MITGPGIIAGLAAVFAFIGAYYALGGGALGVDAKDDDPSQERRPFNKEKLIGDKPWVETPVPEYPAFIRFFK